MLNALNATIQDYQQEDVTWACYQCRPCIRRSSVHEKTCLSAKEMRNEAIQAMRIQESISTPDENDEDDDEQVLAAITVTPEQVNGK